MSRALRFRVNTKLLVNLVTAIVSFVSPFAAGATPELDVLEHGLKDSKTFIDVKHLPGPLDRRGIERCLLYADGVVLVKRNSGFLQSSVEYFRKPLPEFDADLGKAATGYLEYARFQGTNIPMLITIYGPKGTAMLSQSDGKSGSFLKGYFANRASLWVSEFCVPHMGK